MHACILVHARGRHDAEMPSAPAQGAAPRAASPHRLLTALRAAIVLLAAALVEKVPAGAVEGGPAQGVILRHFND